MTALHVIVLVVGVLAAIALADLLAHRGIGAWPVGLLGLAVAPVAGWLYSPWLAAFGLGLMTGAAGVLITRRIHEIQEERRRRR